MNELKFNSQVCTTIEQSKRLLELGLKPETADMYYHEGSEDVAGNIEYHKNIRREREILYPDYIPAWSLDRLMELNSASVMVGAIALLKYDNTYGDIIEDIEWAIKKGYFNKEYLKI